MLLRFAILPKVTRTLLRSAAFRWYRRFRFTTHAAGQFPYRFILYRRSATPRFLLRLAASCIDILAMVKFSFLSDTHHYFPKRSTPLFDVYFRWPLYWAPDITQIPYTCLRLVSFFAFLYHLPHDEISLARRIFTSSDMAWPDGKFLIDAFLNLTVLI